MDRRSFKVCLLGNPRVGKTSIRNNYMGKGFAQNYNMTLGADFSVKRLKDNNVLQIWDLAGQQVYKAVRSGYYKGAEGAILIFDITNPETLRALPGWINEMLKTTNTLVPIVLVGNKVDLRESAKQSISIDDAKKYANELSAWSGFDVQYIESSALTGHNIERIFDNLVEEIQLMHSTEIGS